MKILKTAFMTITVAAMLVWAPVFAQEEIDKDPKFRTSEVMPPPDVRDWTPFDQQFMLYVNFNGQPTDSLTPPWIDILDDKQESCLFWMEKLGDTLYIFIVPPSHVLCDSVRMRNSIDGLECEFPLVVWAGTRRATFWLSYDSGQVILETLQPSDFITTVSLKELPNNVLTLQLEGKNKNAKVLRTLVKELKGQAELIQLDDGFYRNIWFHMRKAVVQRFQTNETRTGTFLAFRCNEGVHDAVARALAKYRQDVSYVGH
jgi:hypothetical protein